MAIMLKGYFDNDLWYNVSEPIEPIKFEIDWREQVRDSVWAEIYRQKRY